jgi:hypothetical protein
MSSIRGPNSRVSCWIVLRASGRVTTYNGERDHCSHIATECQGNTCSNLHSVANQHDRRGSIGPRNRKTPPKRGFLESQVTLGR